MNATGRRRRHACFTVDGDTAKDQSVTARDRDTGAQERIALDKVGDFLAAKLSAR